MVDQFIAPRVRSDAKAMYLILPIKVHPGHPKVRFMDEVRWF
jgi:hypothetical protein